MAALQLRQKQMSLDLATNSLKVGLLVMLLLELLLELLPVIARSKALISRLPTLALLVEVVVEEEVVAVEEVSK